VGILDGKQVEQEECKPHMCSYLSKKEPRL